MATKRENQNQNEQAGPSWADVSNKQDEEDDEKKNRPIDTKLRQQKLPAWQPILTAATVIPTFFVIGIIFLPIGIALYLSSNGIYEAIWDYTTECTTKPGSKDTNDSCQEKVKSWVSQGEKRTCQCTMKLQLNQTLEGDVYFYYGLTNFYQNHRRYVKSRSDKQLLGELTSTGDCAPYQKNRKGAPYAPCGAIANSMFNDTFVLVYKGKSEPYEENKRVPLSHKEIVWPTDRHHKFKNPKGESLKDAFQKMDKPPNWKYPVWNLSKEKDDNGFLNSDFIVWMRTAALPTFRKLWRKLDKTEAVKNKNLSDFKDGLPQGVYNLQIDYNYLVDSFGGRKRFIISEVSWVGGKNDFLGVAYMVVGSLCIMLGIIFLVIHLNFGKSLTEMSTVGGRA